MEQNVTTSPHHAPEALSQLHTPTSDGLVLSLKTLTPLYTGGIGQMGDQIHPSNLLGGIRHMSCLVARTLGDAAFESTVWGDASQNPVHAKQVALRWDTRGLSLIRDLPKTVSFKRSGGKESSWRFNTAFKGDVGLQITRRGISDAHWQILMVALAIQLRHGSFGSKDQFGMGVLALSNDMKFCSALDTEKQWSPATEKLNLLRYAFGCLKFRPLVGQRPLLKDPAALKLALATRVALRNALRAKNDAAKDEVDRMKKLRHLMMGNLGDFGSAVNVSAAYVLNDCPEIRIMIALKSEEPKEQAEVLNAFKKTLSDKDTLGDMNDLIGVTNYCVQGISSLMFGGKHLEDRAAWLNKLAGVAQ